MGQLNPIMSPAPGERLLRFVGDRVRFVLKNRDGQSRPRGWRARLRTPLARASWRDLPMKEDGDGWSLELPVAEVGFFHAKAYCLDEKNWQHWPDGPDAGISVHPDSYRTANTLYCAFPRLFGAARNLVT